MALINLRNALMTGRRLPYDADVEYLENTVVNYANYETIAFPYIDTGIPAADDVGVRITYEYRYLVARQGAMVCGSFVASGSGYFGVYNYGAYNYKMWGGATKMPTQIHVGEVLTTSLNFMESGIYEDVLNGATINSGSLSGSPTFNPGSIWVFAINKGKYSTYEIARLRIYGLKITKGSTLVRDYIPVRKGTVGYLYDRVSGKLFGNAGTGDFVLGPDVVPVEWLESDGNQYIDTGVKPDATYTFDSTVAVMQSNYNCIYWGCRRSGTYTSDNSQCYLTNNTSSTAGEKFRQIRLLSTDANSNANWNSGIVPQTSVFYQLSGMSTVSTMNTMTYPIILFGLNNIGQKATNVGCVRIAKWTVYKSGAKANNFLPVRVGTDATSWEGAMMDVLTRRIYRNAGTGAFTYGNDLKYPIPAE